MKKFFVTWIWLDTILRSRTMAWFINFVWLSPVFLLTTCISHCLSGNSAPTEGRVSRYTSQSHSLMSMLRPAWSLLLDVLQLLVLPPPPPPSALGAGRFIIWYLCRPIAGMVRRAYLADVLAHTWPFITSACVVVDERTPQG